MTKNNWSTQAELNHINLLYAHSMTKIDAIFASRSLWWSSTFYWKRQIIVCQMISCQDHSNGIETTSQLNIISVSVIWEWLENTCAAIKLLGITAFNWCWSFRFRVDLPEHIYVIVQTLMDALYFKCFLQTFCSVCPYCTLVWDNYTCTCRHGFLKTWSRF